MIKENYDDWLDGIDIDNPLDNKETEIVFTNHAKKRARQRFGIKNLNDEKEISDNVLELFDFSSTMTEQVLKITVGGYNKMYVVVLFTNEIYGDGRKLIVKTIKETPHKMISKNRIPEDYRNNKGVIIKKGLSGIKRVKR